MARRSRSGRVARVSCERGVGLARSWTWIWEDECGESRRRRRRGSFVPGRGRGLEPVDGYPLSGEQTDKWDTEVV
jgi:hypothetical protein